MKIGFVGLGNMGKGICSLLLKHGHSVRIYARRPEVLEEFAAKGAIPTHSYAEMAEGVEVCFTCLFGPKDVQNAILGENGISSTMPAGGVCIDMTTIDTETACFIRDELQKKGIAFLSAPLAKGPKEAAEGVCPIYVGGYRETWDKYRELLETVGNPLYLGDIRQALSFKLIQNMMIMSIRCIINEAVKLAKEVGIERDVFLDNVPKTGAMSYQFQTGGALTYDEIYSPVRFSLSLALKDVSLCLKLAEEKGLELPIFEETRRLYQMAEDAGYGDEDSIATYKILKSIKK